MTTASDPTEQARRELIPQMSLELRRRVHAGEQIWTSSQLTEEFDVLGFQAPFVVARRKSDGTKGSLQFTNAPRYYFGWEATA